MLVNDYDAEPWNGVTDYVLHDPSGNILAVVEAKRCSRNPREADEQLRHYIAEISKHQTYAPFGFMTNGLEFWFWEVGQANPRLIAGFFSPQDLQRLLFLLLNAQPLHSVPVNTTIVERPYIRNEPRALPSLYSAAPLIVLRHVSLESAPDDAVVDDNADVVHCAIQYDLRH